MDASALERYEKLGHDLVNEPDFKKILLLLEGNLATIDSEIRERSLDLLWELIESSSLSNQMMLEIANRMITNLRYEIGTKGSDSVFLRTFSVLIIALIISQDELMHNRNHASFLSYKDYRTWYAEILQYVKDERDYRGYVMDKGWAHAISHSADVLRDLAFHRYSRKEEHLEILNLISSKFHTYGNSIFINNDDNRLVRIVMVIMLRDTLQITDLSQWLDKLSQSFKGQDRLSTDREERISRFNTITFLRALYFTLSFGMKKIKNAALFEREPTLRHEMMKMVLDVLKSIDNGLNYSSESN